MTPDGLIGLLSSVSCGAFVLTTDQTVVFWNDRAQEILGYRAERVVGRRCSAVAGGAVAVTLSEGCEDGCPMMRSLRDGQMPGRARLRARCSWGEWKWLVVTPMAVSGVEQSGPLLVYLFGDAGEEAAAADVERLVELGGGAGHWSGETRYAGPRAYLSAQREEVLGADEEEEKEGWLRRSASTHDEEQSRRMRQDPASGQSAEDFPAEIRRAIFRSPRSGDVAGSDERRPSEAEPREVRLTDRQLEVLSYLALGWETKYIAEELGVSWYTVRKHIENLRRRLGASSRLDAVMIAVRLGIIPPE